MAKLPGAGRRKSTQVGSALQTSLHECANAEAFQELRANDVPPKRPPGRPLRIVSINLKACKKRLHALHDQTKSMLHPYDIICMQDPPLEVCFRKHSHYLLKSFVPDGTTEEDNPYNDGCTSTARSVGLYGVAFYVHDSIPISDWKPKIYDGFDLFATLHFKTGAGWINIHNVYNRLKQLDVDQLFITLALTSSDVFLGDLNLHDKWWGGFHMRQPEELDAHRLASAMRAHDMTLLTIPGTTTFSRSSRPDQENTTQPEQQCSTIDLAFVGPAITGWNPHWEVLDVPGFESDHRVTQVTLPVTPTRIIQRRSNLNNANSRYVCATTEERLKMNLDLSTPLITVLQLEEFADKFGDLCQQTINDVAPPTQRHHSIQNPRQLPHVKAAFEKAVKFGRTNSLRIAQARTQYQALSRKADRLLKLAKRDKWRNFISGRTDCFRTARLSESLRQPLRAPYLEKLVIDEGRYGETKKGDICDTTRTIYRAFRDHWWSETSDTAAIPIQQPDADPQREQYTYQPGLEHGKVHRLIGNLKINKRGGVDGISNRFLKMTRHIIVPYLEHMFG